MATNSSNFSARKNTPYRGKRTSPPSYSKPKKGSYTLWRPSKGRSS